MGLCSSKNLKELEKLPAVVAAMEGTGELPGLTPEEQERFGLTGVRDALVHTVEKALGVLLTPEDWEAPDVKIHAPCKDKIDSLKQRLLDVPFVGGSLSEELQEHVVDFEKELSEGAVAVAKDPRTMDCFVKVITETSPADVLGLISTGGKEKTDAFVDDLKVRVFGMLLDVLRPHVKEVLEEQRCTRAWMTFKDKFNFLATKVDCVDPIDTDLSEHVLNKATEGIAVIMHGMEANLRLDPAAAVSHFVQQVLTNPFDPAKWKFPAPAEDDA